MLTVVFLPPKAINSCFDWIAMLLWNTNFQRELSQLDSGHKAMSCQKGEKAWRTCFNLWQWLWKSRFDACCERISLGGRGRRDDLLCEHVNPLCSQLKIYSTPPVFAWDMAEKKKNLKTAAFPSRSCILSFKGLFDFVLYLTLYWPLNWFGNKIVYYFDFLFSLLCSLMVFFPL